MIDTNRSRLLDSCYFESQTWGALHKAWKGYVIAKNKYELEKRIITQMLFKSYKESSDYLSPLSLI
jgi:hypothetical protein